MGTDNKNFYTKKLNVILLATICCFLWGSAYPAIKIGYKLFNISSSDSPSKFIFAGYRFALAGFIVLLVTLFIDKSKKALLINKSTLKEVTILGLTQTTLQYIFFYIGMTYTTGVRGSIITGSGTFFSLLMAHYIYRNDKLNKNKILGCLIGFFGVILVNLNDSSLFQSSFTFKGEFLVLLAAITLSASSIYSKKITQNNDSFIVTGFQLLIGGVTLTLLGFILGGNLSGFTFKSTSLLIYMAVLSSVAFSLWTILLKYNKVGSISIFNFLIPVFGSLLSALFLGENIFDIKILISLILVSFGIFLVNKSS